MPGPMNERPRAYRLTDIDPQHVKGINCGLSDDSNSLINSGNNMGSIARFPKLDECAHFHYEHVELGSLEVTISEDPDDSDNDNYNVRVTSGDACWTLQRSYENFVLFDKQLHRCIFDRKFSALAKLPEVPLDYSNNDIESDDDNDDVSISNTSQLLKDYMTRFSKLNHDGLNCGPVLNWLQLDNRGRRILVPESDSCPINTPAVAAAYAVRPYTAQAQDEISFQVGDMISVIDMPPPGESTWWRGKHGFAVGFFPAECVAVIGDKVPRHLAIQHGQASKYTKMQPVKPVLRKHGKLIAFFRSFILNRPSRRRLKQSGILKERVFGCDLGEHLLNSGQDVPRVLTCCAEFIEKYGLVDGIYRLSGVSSNIQKLRNAFDEDRVPALNSDQGILQDIHSVASLLKMYFRELPNPLCTYQLYSTFVGAVQSSTDGERLRRMRDAVRKLPPPHYRTLEYLMQHLVRVSARGGETGMTPRNVAIVWAPNLLRCKELEVGGVAALQGVGVQAVVTEFLICYADLIFGDAPFGRPKSLAITTPARLLSLEEARNRSLRGETDYIQVGSGPAGLPHQYHTVIELPRKRNGSKRSPSLNWRALFGGKGRPSTCGKSRPAGTPPQTETVPNSVNSLRRLRTVKSADSLDGEDSLGPLLGPPPSRTCGHNRSISHDSYFDHLGDGSNATSPLDLSEIQLNFDLEEREMKMLSEEECIGIASVEASPRRQRAEVSQSSTAANGGSKRKRSRLEERLQCDVELRFIDSQSPDQVMVSADVHEMETPSPLPTPGYLPLLSEASTPLTPATLRGTPLSISPGTTTTSPRISFRSFTLPLEISEEENNEESYNQHSSNSISSNKASNDASQSSQSRPLSISFNDQDILRNCTNGLELYERLLDSSRDEQINKSTESSLSDSKNSTSEIIDQEMAPCDKILHNNGNEAADSSYGKSMDTTTCKDSTDALSFYLDSKPLGKADNLSPLQEDDITTPSPIEVIAGMSNAQGNDTTGMPLSSLTDLDSPMSCEQTCEDIPDSGFAIYDGTEKVLTNSDNISLTCTVSETPEWVMAERTVGSIPNSISETPELKTSSSEDTINPAIAENIAISEKLSRTSLDLTMCSTVETDTSCVGTSDSISSSILNSSSADILLPNINDNQDCRQESEKSEQIDANSKAKVSVPSVSSKPSNNIDSVNSENAKSDSKFFSANHQINESDNQAHNCDCIINNMNNCDTEEINKSKVELSNNIDCNFLDTTEKRKNKDIFKNESPQFSIQELPQNSQNQYQETQIKNFDSMNSESQNIQSINSNEKYNNSAEEKHMSQFQTKELLNMESSQMQDDLDITLPSDNAAAEPQEMAYIPEMESESVKSTNHSSIATSSNEVASNRDTASILQELALQRLSGNISVELTSPIRRRLDSDSRSFDSEIGREIVRQHKMRQELENARGKSDESPNKCNSSQHLPPCLRARHARATRAALSRSLDEGKFNKMTSESLLCEKQNCNEGTLQHSSTPNVDFQTSSITTKSHPLSKSMIQPKNLGGLDLDDPGCRERIEKYKQERRTFLRDKYKSESFKGIVTAALSTITTTITTTTSNTKSVSKSKTDEDEDKILLARLKQRVSRPPPIH